MQSECRIKKIGKRWEKISAYILFAKQLIHTYEIGIVGKNSEGEKHYFFFFISKFCIPIHRCITSKWKLILIASHYKFCPKVSATLIFEMRHIRRMFFFPQGFLQLDKPNSSYYCYDSISSIVEFLWDISYLYHKGRCVSVSRI